MSHEEETPLTPETAFVRLQAWYIDKRRLSEAKSAEHLERTTLTKFYFKQPREGTNRLALGGGYDLILKHGYDYKVDEVLLDQVTPEQITELKLPWDDLFVYKPKLSIKTYRLLSAEQKLFVDALLDIKESSPQLDIGTGKQADAPVPEEVGPVYASVVDDMEKAQIGDFYEDADNDWWQVGEDGNWISVEKPTNIAPPKPAPARRSRKQK